ncbi:MAG: hypothetical protein EAZ91_16600 [Cytophagales bacterium]|nr:MAG: hypothetical protein EAZ91_16600 [Cytophagales bacterium]
MLVNTHNGYETGNGLNTMVGDIQNQIGGTAGGTALGICHSMGGVAARQIDVQNTGFFSGIMTFDSPLRGARVVTNVNNGVAADYISHAVSQLRKGPFRQYFPIPQIALPIAGIRDIDFFAGERFVQSQREEQNLTPATAADLADESGYNQQFYGNATPTPKLIYWGNEVSPIHIRLFAGSLGVNEESAVNAFNEIRQYYGDQRDENYTLRWIFFGAFPFYTWRGDGWAAGYDYLAGQSENEWANLIGAGYSYTRSYYTFEFVGTDYNAYLDCVNYANGDPVQIQNCENTYFQWVHHDEVVFARDQSDGLVPRRSQVGEGTHWSGSNSEIRELANNSHNEVRRSNESRFEINEAFNGNRSGGAFFVPQ